MAGALRFAFRPLRVALAVLFLVALVIGAALAWTATEGGRAFVARQAALVTPHSGLRIRIGRLDGVPLSRFTARDIALSDPKGVFLTIPAATIEWHPLAFARNRLELVEVSAPIVRVLRVPAFLPSNDPNQPLLPGFDIALGRLAVDRIEVAPAIAGRALTARLRATADIAGGRAVVDANAASSAGDALAVALDSRPDDDRFALKARLNAPLGGLIAALVGSPRPLAARIDGAGSWTHWRGHLATDLGGAALANLALAADGGRFGVAGRVAPAAWFGPGLVAQLTGPALGINAHATLADRRLTLAARATGPALTANANGVVDLGQGRFERIAVDGRLLRPAALSPQLSGPPIAFNAVVTGPIVAPTIDARAAAPLARAGTLGLIAPRLGARVTLGRAPLVIPIELSATRADGLPPRIGELAANLSVRGPLTIAGGVVRADRLVVTTARANARVGLTYTFATGAYAAAVDGALPRYTVAGLGVVDLAAHVRVTPGAGGGGVAVAGPFSARVTRLDAAAVLKLTGGLPIVTGNATLAPGGAVRVEGLLVAAPRLRLAGSASLAANGALAARLDGRSADYGPVALGVAGTIAKPSADLALARPGLGVGLTDVRAQVRSAPGGFAITARGGSRYGPFVADVGLQTGGPGLALDVRALTLAGITARGRIAPMGKLYAGDLTLVGEGVHGDVRLSDQAGVQRADLALTLVKARLVAAKPTLTVAGGRVAASLLLPASGPEGSATADLTGVKRDTLSLTRVSARGGYAHGQGTAHLSLAGEANAPFTLVADVAGNAQRVTAMASGDIDGQPVRLAAPAVVTRDGPAWRLAPATLLVADGRATVAGRIDGDTQLNARVENIQLDDLYGIGALNMRGAASGTANFTIPANGIPQGTAQLYVRQFSRAALATVSLPIDIEAAAALKGGVGAARGFIRRQGKVLGAFQAQISAIPGSAADPPLERLLAAPVHGEVRLQAPAEAVWPLAGVDALDVRGPIAVTATIFGHLGQPDIDGTVRAIGARAEAAALGTVITGIQLEAAFDGPVLNITRFTGRVGDGSISATGRVALTDAQGFTANLNAQLANARMIKTDMFTTAVTGPTTLKLDRNGGLISGDVRIDSGRYLLGTTPAEAVPELKVREIGLRPPTGRPTTTPDTQWRLALHAAARSRFNVRGLGLDSDWGADVRVTGSALEPSITGRATLARGNYEFSGKTFRLDRGEIRFTGEYPPNPSVDIQATANVTGLTAVLTIGGSAFKPEIAFTSTPALPEDEVLSRLLFGSSVTDLSAPEALQLAAAVASLRGGNGHGLNPINTLRRFTGLDRLRVNGADKTTGRGTSVAAGKYIGRNIYVEVASDAKGYTATQIELSLTRWLSVLSSVASQGSNSVSVRVSKDY